MQKDGSGSGGYGALPDDSPSPASPSSRPVVCLFTRIWRGNGTGLFAQGLADGLVEAGADVIFICPRTTSEAFERPRPHMRRLRQPRERDGAARPIRILASLSRMAGGALALARARFRTRIFIVTLPDPFIISVPIFWLLRLSGARILLVAHDPVPHAWKLPERLRRLEIAGYRALYKVASAVVVLSEPSRTKLLAAFPDLDRPVAVIDHGPFIMADVGPMPGRGRILCFGTLRRNKGILEAMQGVVAAHADGLPVHLVVAGGAHKEDPAYAEACLDFARNAPQCVEMKCDYVADDAVGDLIAGSDVLLMPYSDFHSQSGVALLAASNGRPVIASDAGGLATLLDEGMPGIRIAPPMSVGTIRAAIGEFCAVPHEQWIERVAVYRERTLDQRAWKRLAGQYVALAKTLLEKR